MNFLARRRSIFTLLAALSVLLVGGTIYSRLLAQETRETREIAPGISLLAVSTQTPSGPLRYWLVKSDKAAEKLAIEVANARDINKKRSVRALAKQAGAVVAVNGGFFAYDGAAVGAVKVEGEWHRLPWKSRTALLWNENGAQIASLSGKCRLKIDFATGTSQTVDAALNGFALPGSHQAQKDGFCVLTSRFAPKYRLKTGEIAVSAAPGVAFIEGNSRPIPLMQSVSSGVVAIPEKGFIVVARGAAVRTLQPDGAPAPLVSFTVETSLPESNKFPQILGAGPLLVQDGIVKTTEKAEEFRPDVLARGPRTCVGFDSAGNTLILVVNGWEAASIGLTLPETAQLFRSLGAVQAMNLDGGGSTQLVVAGEFVNAPLGYVSARETSVSNALVLKGR